MSPRFAIALGALVVTSGCAKPAQSGGLGVFHPQGFEGRMVLAGEYAEGRSLQTEGETRKPALSK